MQRFIPETSVEEVRQRSDLVGLVGEYLRLDKKGKNYVGLCPFHSEKTPSFTVSPDKQLFYCFGCGASGNIFSFIMKMENLEFPDAVRYLASRAGVTIPEREESREDSLKEQILNLNLLAARYFAYCLNNTAGGKKAIGYLERRGITRQSQELFKLGYAPPQWRNFLEVARARGYDPDLLVKAGLVSRNEKGKYFDRFRHRLMFPIFNLSGQVIGFGGRALDDSEKAGPKYLNSPETPVFNKGAVLYGLNLAREQIRRENTVIVMEGYIDVITAFQQGVRNAVASLGTALTTQQGRLLRSQAETAIIAFDADSAGEAATWRGLKILKDSGCMVKVAAFPAGRDPDSFIREKGLEAFKALIDEAKLLVEYQLDSLRASCDLTSTEGSRRYLEAVLPVLNDIENRLERDLYIKKISEELGITEESLRVELKKKIRKTRQKQESDNNLADKDQTNTIKQTKVDPAEKLLLSLILQEEGIVFLVQNNLRPELIQDSRIRRVVEMAVDYYGSGKGVLSAGELIDRFDDVEVHGLITTAATDPSFQNLSQEKIERMAKDCIHRLISMKLKRHREELQKKIREAEKEGMDEEARNLLREQWKMIVEMEDTHRSGEGEEFGWLKK